MRRTATVLLSLMVVLGAHAGSAHAESGIEVGPAAVGTAMPAFSADRLDGGEVTTADLAGRPALLLFFATSCPRCKRLAPGIERTWQRYGDAGLQVVAISVREAGNVQAWRTENASTFDFAVDGDEAAAAFGVRDLPTWFFADAGGVIRFRGTSSDPDDPVFDLVAADLLGIDPEDCGVALC